MGGIRKLGQIREGRYLCCASHRAKFLQREGYFLHCGLATECSNEWISSAAFLVLHQKASGTAGEAMGLHKWNLLCILAEVCSWRLLGEIIWLCNSPFLCSSASGHLDLAFGFYISGMNICVLPLHLLAFLIHLRQLLSPNTCFLACLKLR